MEAALRQARFNNPALYAFLLRMPKGADLHNHLAGAVYAENYLREAAEEHLCIDLTQLSLVDTNAQGHCQPNQANAADTETNPDFGSRMVDSLSMRAFVPGPESGHDHFFDAFEKFAPASHNGDGDAVAEVVTRAAQQNESYLELMALSGASLLKLAKEAGFNTDFAAGRENLNRLGIDRAVDALRRKVDVIEADRIRLLHCNSDPGSAACRVKVRYIFQVLRNMPPAAVYTQILAGFMLCARDPRVVAVNLVQPEDYFYSMRDYHLHMQMIDFVKRLYPHVHITLHAGELTSGLVPPEGLRFHVSEAIMLGHAERIGHGVDIGYELDSFDLLRTMRQRHVDVEINLSSNDEILGIRGNDHPFPLYRKMNVPVTLSTDDEGVGRTHLTVEYQRAVQTYNLTYADVKEIVRNSLEYSFLPGESYWSDTSYRQPIAACAHSPDSGSCTTFLKTSEKAAAQSDLEVRFKQFEAQPE